MNMQTQSMSGSDAATILLQLKGIPATQVVRNVGNRKEVKLLEGFCKQIFEVEQLAKDSTVNDTSGGQTTGTQRVAFLPSPARKKVITLQNEMDKKAGLAPLPMLHDDSVPIDVNAAYRAIILRTVRGLKLTNGNVSKIHEAELLATPPNTVMQDKHRDSRYNHLTLICYLSRNTKLSTWFSRETAWDCKDIEKLEYTRLEVKAGDALVNHACVPHGGPGNASSTQWRYVLFVAFALDEEATQHWCDEEVIRNN